ncbi:hypothetical protein HDU76_004213 [Blyttiomyces sp. JEL0837]|nr:hypothetical protein HDU76_004213 [Blyttiomyces sp. JEL0837]
MQSYLNVHLALEAMRDDSAKNGAHGPKVMIVGPADVGKSALSKILLNYAIKCERKPVFMDIDTNEGSVTMPGSMTASVFSRNIDVEEEFGGTPVSTGSTPLVYYYGYSSPTEKAKLYSRLVTKLAEVVGRKYDSDPDVRGAGIVINTPFQFTEPTGHSLLTQAIDAIKPSAVLIIGHERLYSDLSRNYQGISIVKLAKSGGVVTRDKAFRRLQQNAKIRQYFYGTPKTTLSPCSTIVSFKDITVRRVEGTLAPSSALPLGMERKLQENRIVKVEPGDILLNSVLAVTNADRLDAAPVMGSAPALTTDEETTLILDRNVAGFVYVSEVDDIKNKLNVLAPNPGRLPKKYMLMGSLKWLET